jgi:hypothetical protein
LTDYVIELRCPQCGAPADLEESDRFFHCAFCRVGSYLTAPGTMRYTLAHQAPAGKQIYYFPYWRFKGMLFSCLAQRTDQRFVDTSQQAIGSLHFPISLGFRSQTRKLQFAASQPQGVFLKPDLAANDFIQLVQERFSANLPKPVLRQACIGESLSLLYAPFYRSDGKIFDAVLNEPLPEISQEALMKMLARQQKPNWPITFLPALCPRCGWDLAGSSDSLALTCTNCQSCWWEKKGRLQELACARVDGSGSNDIYLPFWRIQADVSHVQLRSYADLIRLANLPRVIQPAWEHRRFYFWSPAFKIRPHNLLTLAGNITLQQPADKLTEGQPAAPLQPINMPLREAVESLTLTLSGFVRPRERMVQLIEDIVITERRFLLVYIPFRQGHHEFVNDSLNLAINKNLLVHSKNL